MYRYLTLAVLCLHFVPLIVGYMYLQEQIPNGQSVPHPCKPNFIFHGVGHINPKGGGDRNPFGIAFENAGLNWKTVCALDSDGDGRTNGEELGDPDCKWKTGDIPDRTEQITHPGVCDPWDSDACKSKNTWIDCNPENDFKCPAFSEAGMMNTTLRFPETLVPPTETNYYCMVFDLPQDGDYHLVGTTPHIDNRYVMHHIVLFGCEESADPELAKYNTPTPCGEIMQVGKCNSILGGWSVGNDGECYHGDVGMRIGTNGYKKVMVEFHWNNPELKSNYVDSSGMNLYYTANRRQYDAGVLITGQTYLEIPARMDRVDSFGTCSADCTRKQLTGPIRFTWASNHMHYLGRAMKMEHYRNGVKIQDLTNDEVYSYDSPVTYHFNEPIEFLPGDEIKTTCRFRSKNKKRTTYQGEGTSDEMCFGFLMYYPKESVTARYCGSWRSIATCQIYTHYMDFPVIDDCEWLNMVNTSHPYTKNIIDGVNTNCVPFGPCTPECIEEVQKIKNHACINSDIGEHIKNRVWRYKIMDLVNFYAGINSCAAEMAVMNLTPCCVGCS